jgi:DNA-binding MurR/RpiR family transcriptional regulator
MRKDQRLADRTSNEADSFSGRAARYHNELGPAGQRVVRYIEQNPAAALASSAQELAAAASTSDATVIRTAQTLGYGGLADLKQALVATLDGKSTAADDMRRTLAGLDAGAIQALDMVLEAHQDALDTLRSPGFREQMGRVLPVLHMAERIVVFGIGPSSAIARYVVTVLARSGRNSKCLDSTGIMLADQMLDLRSGDAVLALAYGRAYREVTGLFREARRLRLPVVLVSESDDSPLAKSADVVVVIPRGKRQRVALHGGTLVGMEALALMLAAVDPEKAVATLDRLNVLRTAVSGQRHDVG